MITIQPPSLLFQVYIPAPRFSPGFFRPSSFLYLLRREKCWAFHTLTRQVAELTPEEERLLSCGPVYLESLVPDRAALFSSRFLVPAETDETTLYCEAYRLFRTLKPLSEKKELYKIFTTTACNARCFYCFEAGTPVSTMTEQTADETTAYIEKTRADGEIVLYWFGGEPLCNRRAIDRICASLREKNILFRSELVTNGSLLNEATVRDAVSLWNLKLCQISLDGTSEEYARRKAYVNPENCSLEHVLHNTELLLDAGVRVQLRLNLDRENAGDILLLKDDLLRRFSGREHIWIYPAVISPDWLGYHDPRKSTVNADSRVRSAYDELKKDLAVFRPTAERGVGRDFPSVHCMANSPQCTVINPDGELYTCQGCDDTMRYGNIRDGVTEPQILKDWTENGSPRESCRGCVWLPECTAFRSCPAAGDGCREEQEQRLRRRLLYTLKRAGVQNP